MASIQDTVAGAVPRIVGELPRALQRALAGTPVTIDGLTLHPEVQLLVKLLELSPGPSFEELPVADARAKVAHEASLFSGPVAEVGRVDELELPGADGPLPGRFYVPTGDASPRPLLVFFHGGGWVVGDLDTHDSPCRFITREGELLVLSVGYRRAPEHRFPAAVEDALAAFRWAVANASELGADPHAIAVGGDSAGGNLAAVVAQLATRDGGPAPAFQLLFYPVTDLSTKRRSYELFSEGFFLSERQMDWYRGHYLPDRAATLDPRASPLLAEDVSGLPPAYIAVAGFDILRDEGEEYAARLRDAGVPVALRRHPGIVHGFVNAVDVGRVGREATLEAVGALRLGLATARSR
jgi:acetyl esterase